jgi:4-amino-4-deoxychorismate lyase
LPPSPEIVLIDGTTANPAAGGGISPYDRGLQFGDGLFETIACRSGIPRFLSWHLERLSLGCQRLAIPLPNLPQIRDEVRMLASGAQNSLVKIMLTRGVATARGYAPSGHEKPTRVTFRYPWPHENPAWSQDGVRVRVATLRVGENPALAGLKHLNRLEQVLAKMESMDTPHAQSAQETLLFSSSGRLVSGSMSNVFIVRGSRVQTPLIDVCGVAGVMRRVVLSEAIRAGVPVEECALRAEDLQDAQEIFLTNARIGIWPVRALESRTFSPGPITRRLQRHLTPLLEDPGDA